MFLQDPRWGDFADRVLHDWGGPHPRAGKKSDQAHPPIHPTKPGTGLQVHAKRQLHTIIYWLP